MKKRMRVGAVAVLATAGALAMGAPASADIGDVQTQGENITIPIQVCGNSVNVIAVPVLSDATGVCESDVNNVQVSGGHEKDHKKGHH